MTWSMEKHQTMVDRTLNRKLKIEKQESN